MSKKMLFFSLSTFFALGLSQLLADTQPSSSKNPTISIVERDGNYLILSDDSKYLIKPEDRVKVSGWLIAPNVAIKDTKDLSDYPVEITNLDVNATVRAKKGA